MDRIDGVDLPRCEALTIAGCFQKLAIKAQAVVGDQPSIPHKPGKGEDCFLLGRSIGHIPIRHACKAGNMGRDWRRGPNVLEETLTPEDFTSAITHSCYLNDLTFLG